MSCQGIQKNGVRCSNKVRPEYGNKYCGIHKDQFYKQPHSDNDLKKFFLDFEKRAQIERERDRRLFQDAINQVMDVVMTSAEDVKDRVTDDGQMTRQMIAYNMMVDHHKKYVNNKDLLSDPNKVEKLLNDLLFENNDYLLHNLKQSPQNKVHFMNLIKDYIRFLSPTDQVEFVTATSESLDLALSQ